MSEYRKDHAVTLISIRGENQITFIHCTFITDPTFHCSAIYRYVCIFDYKNNTFCTVIWVRWKRQIPYINLTFTTDPLSVIHHLTYKIAFWMTKNGSHNISHDQLYPWKWMGPLFCRYTSDLRCCISCNISLKINKR